MLGALCGTAASVQAGEYAALRESLRARGMGGAFTAVANDEYALFYNPAGLRSVYYNIFTFFNAASTLNQTTTDFGNEANASSALSSYSGKKMYLEPLDIGLLSFVNSRFGWSLFGNSLLDFQINSISGSNVDATFQAYGQFGGVLGGAWSFFDHQLDVGISGKVAYRTGAKSTVTVTEAVTVVPGGLTRVGRKNHRGRARCHRVASVRLASRAVVRTAGAGFLTILSTPGLP